MSKRMQKGKRIISGLLALVLLLGCMPSLTPMAKAATGLSLTAGGRHTAANGGDYSLPAGNVTNWSFNVPSGVAATLTVSGATTIDNRTAGGGSPISVQTGGTLNLVVNGTLTVYGQHGQSGQVGGIYGGGKGGNGGFAGVYAGGTLWVKGAGTVSATGGNAGHGGDGFVEKNPTRVEGTGGGGGGGAGAGIGGNGAGGGGGGGSDDWDQNTTTAGAGGTGGTGTNAGNGANGVTNPKPVGGLMGMAGGAGGKGGDAGKIYISVANINAAGGAGGNGGADPGDSGNDGGAGGGGGYPGAGIGGGGGGAGGGCGDDNAGGGGYSGGGIALNGQPLAPGGINGEDGQGINAEYRGKGYLSHELGGGAGRAGNIGGAGGALVALEIADTTVRKITDPIAIKGRRVTGIGSGAGYYLGTGGDKVSANGASNGTFAIKKTVGATTPDAPVSGTKKTAVNGESYTIPAGDKNNWSYVVPNGVTATLTVPTAMVIDNRTGGGSPIEVMPGGTLNLVVNNTLTLYGQHGGSGEDGRIDAGGSGGVGGAAGIYTGGTLYVRGTGTLNAYGGNAGNGGDGQMGINGLIEGTGGGGGGGAGAGIGGNGGGGGGGNDNERQKNPGTGGTGGVNAGAGGVGDNVILNEGPAGFGGVGGNAGKIYMFMAKVNATGGAGGNGGTDFGDVQTKTLDSGAGGGGGYPGAGIGGGGGGAGGGGGDDNVGGGGYSGGGTSMNDGTVKYGGTNGADGQTSVAERQAFGYNSHELGGGGTKHGNSAYNNKACGGAGGSLEALYRTHTFTGKLQDGAAIKGRTVAGVGAGAGFYAGTGGNKTTANGATNGVYTDAEAPSVPRGITVASGVRQVTVSWAVSSSLVVPTYKVYRSATVNGTYTLVTTTAAGATSFVDTGLTNNTTYYYKVSAVNAAGESAQSTPAASGTTHNIPGGITLKNPVPSSDTTIVVGGALKTC